MCPAAGYALISAGHAGPALQDAAIAGGCGHPPLRTSNGAFRAGRRPLRAVSPVEGRTDPAAKYYERRTILPQKSAICNAFVNNFLPLLQLFSPGGRLVQNRSLTGKRRRIYGRLQCKKTSHRLCGGAGHYCAGRGGVPENDPRSAAQHGLPLCDHCHLRPRRQPRIGGADHHKAHGAVHVHAG